MFNKILIANRGEIACRIIRTARRLGIATVAVHSDADARALHVREADEAVHIGPAPAGESYLSIERMVDACRRTGAEAVHPGYGFLSENARFVRALDEAGIAFIGPNAAAIEAMGDKIESKRIAEAAGVSTVPGHPRAIADVREAADVAEDIGYPVMIKASAGGGGKGMRIARNGQELDDGFARAVSEAGSSFGDERVFIEKLIERPRHIEIQVLGDRHGNVIHLGERECSIQRRNQKVIEEAPSAFVDAAMRDAMGRQAVALAKAVGYDSAGTVEFIVDAAGNFYFLEMNTRLQVEHPVTELVTGIDIVEQMIRVAAGEPLAIEQSDVTFDGWAIEARIYAEDPSRNFLPSTGRLVHYRPPPEGLASDGSRVRIDSGVYEGGEISIYYDPLIAKLCTHGRDRDSAVDHMAHALDRFVIDGIRNNTAFLAAVMRNPRWRSADISTGFLAEEYPDGFSGMPPEGRAGRILASIAAAMDDVENRRKRRISGQMDGRPVVFASRRVVDFGTASQRVEVLEDGRGLLRIVHLDADGKIEADVAVAGNWTPGKRVWEGEVDGVPVFVQVRPILNGYRLSYAGIETAAYVYTETEARLAALMPAQAAADTSRVLLCPMPGLMVSIAVEVGQEVKTGEPLCVVEAMKMENILRAERDGVVARINCKPGDTLAVDDVIMEFE